MQSTLGSTKLVAYPQLCTQHPGAYTLPSATHSGVQKHSYYTEQLSNILQPPFSHPSVGHWQKHVWIGHQKWDPKSLAFRVWRVWALIVIMFHGICSILELKAAGSTVFAAFLSSNLSFSMEFATFCHFGAWTVHVCNKLFRLGLGSIYGWFKVYLGLVYGLFRFGWASMWGWFRVCLGFIQAWFRIYLELV